MKRIPFRLLPVVIQQRLVLTLDSVPEKNEAINSKGSFIFIITYNIMNILKLAQQSFLTLNKELNATTTLKIEHLNEIIIRTSKSVLVFDQISKIIANRLKERTNIKKYDHDNA